MDLMALFDDYVPPAQEMEEDDILDLIEEMFGEFGEETDYRSYLHKESLILSLVREKKKRPIGKDSEYGKFLDSIRYEKLMELESAYKKEERLTDACYRHIVCPMLAEMEQALCAYEQQLKLQTCDSLEAKNDPVYPASLFSGFHRYFPEDAFTLSKANGMESYLMHLCMADRSSPKTVKMTYRERGGERSVLLPLSGKLRKRYLWTSRKVSSYQMPYTTVVDGTVLGKRVLIGAAKRMFHEYVAGRALSDLRDDVVVGETLARIADRLEYYHAVKDGCLTVDVELCKKYGYDLASLAASLLDVELIVRPCEEREGLKEHHLGYLSFFYDVPDAGLSSLMLNFEAEIAVHFLLLLLRELHETKRHEQYERNLMESAARVFETKKNIPEKYLKAMADSDLNEVFGYVEIDEDCDLASIKEIEKEFLGFKQEFFKDRLFKDHAIRFRKLGRHHAAGLYFPSLRCLCVDIRTPSSFIHEYLHMIDHSVGDQDKDHSARRGFLRIRNRYEHLLRTWMEEAGDGDPTVRVLKGNTKYNLSYYLEPTEIFARCGEMYFKRVVGVNSSLLGKDSGFAYPEDELLMKMVREYFDALFGASITEVEYGAKVS